MYATRNATSGPPGRNTKDVSVIADQIAKLTKLKGGASADIIEFHLKSVVPALPALDQWRLDRTVTMTETKPLPLNINKIIKNTKRGPITYYYHRATKKRLPDDPESATFMLAYAREQATCAPDKSDTMPMLVSRYMGSPEYRGLAQSTKRSYEKHISNFAATFTDMPVIALEDPQVRIELLEWRDQFASNPRTADLALASVSAMIGWAVDRRILQFHALKGVKKLHKADRSEIIWEQEILSRFIKLAPKHIAAVVLFAAYTGQRQSDVLELKWEHITDDKKIRLKISKSGKRHAVTIHSSLAEWLKHLPRYNETKYKRYNGTILTTSKKGSWTADGFRASYNKFLALEKYDDDELQVYAFENDIGIDHAQECRELAKDIKKAELHFHDLRGTAVTKLADAGATNSEIAAVTGHSLETVDKILKKYMKPTERQGEAAMKKWQDSEQVIFDCPYKRA